MKNSNTIWILIYSFIHLPIACSSENNSIEQETITLHSFNTLQLKTVFEFSEDEDVAFQNIARIHMDIYGNILIRDFFQPQLYMFDGASETSFFHPLTPVEVTSEERDSVLNSLPNQVRSEMRRQFPDIKPIVNGLLVDDQKNIWVDILTEELGQTSCKSSRNS